jgi:hypothetical protein
VTTITIGYGDIVPLNTLEKLFTIFVILLGVSFYSYIIGNIIDIMSQFNKKRNKLNSEVLFLDSYVRNWNISQSLRNEIIDCLKED